MNTSQGEGTGKRRGCEAKTLNSRHFAFGESLSPINQNGDNGRSENSEAEILKWH